MDRTVGGKGEGGGRGRYVMRDVGIDLARELILCRDLDFLGGERKIRDKIYITLMAWQLAYILA